MKITIGYEVFSNFKCWESRKSMEVENGDPTEVSRRFENFIAQIDGKGYAAFRWVNIDTHDLDYEAFDALEARLTNGLMNKRFWLSGSQMVE